MTKVVTEEMKSAIVKLYNNGLGLSQAQIGKEFGIHESTVSYWLMSEERREKVKGNARQKFMEYCNKRQAQKERCCTHCKKIKPTSDFFKTSSYCKDCRREYGRGYNKTYNRSMRLKANDKVRRKIKKKEVALILGGKCQDCCLQLTDENLCVFDLHHKDLTDKESGDRDWRKPQMMQKILDGKIMLLCANCHRMVHHKNGDCLYTIPKKYLPKIKRDHSDPQYQNFVKTSEEVNLRYKELLESKQLNKKL